MGVRACVRGSVGSKVGPWVDCLLMREKRGQEGFSVSEPESAGVAKAPKLFVPR